MELTEMDVRDAQVIMVYFWGRDAERWPVNQQVLKTLAEILSNNKHCSKAMDFVPRPGFPLNASYLKRQLKSIARRIASGGGNYEACRLAIAYRYKGIIRSASAGL